MGTIFQHYHIMRTSCLCDKTLREARTHLKEDIDHPKVCQDAQGQQEVKGSRLDSIRCHCGLRHIIEHPLRVTFVSLEVGDPRLICVSKGGRGGL